MPEQSIADLQRLVDRSRRDSRHNYGAHPTGAGGSLHAPHPKQGAGRKQIGSGEFGLSRPPIGEIIRLHVHGHLGNGGEPALFDSITYQNGFNQATAPNPQLQLPYNAIYGIEGEVRWADGYTGGGEVWLYLDAAPYMQLPGFTGAWTRFDIAMEFDAQKGARLSLVVVHDDSADHDLEGEVVVATKERLVQLVAEEQCAGWFLVESPPVLYRVNLDTGSVEESIDISSNFDGGLYGMGWDGSSFWVQDQFNSPQIHQMSPTGIIESTINGPGFGPIVHDGSRLWHADPFGATVTEVDPSDGTTLSSFAGPNGAGGHWAITFDGTNLWLGKDETVWQVDMSGTLLATVPLAVSAGEHGTYSLGWHNGMLLVGDNDSTDDLVTKVVDPSDGSVLDSWTAPTQLTPVSGITTVGC